MPRISYIDVVRKCMKDCALGRKRRKNSDSGNIAEIKIKREREKEIRIIFCMYKYIYIFYVDYRIWHITNCNVTDTVKYYI